MSNTYRNVSMISYRFIQLARNFDTHKYKQHTRKKQSLLLSLKLFREKNVNNFLSHKYKVYVVLQIALHNLL